MCKHVGVRTHTKVTHVSKELGKHEINQRDCCNTSADYQGTWE